MTRLARPAPAAPAADDPASVPVAHTLEWLDRVLPDLATPARPRVLEVGCGRGALAAALLARRVDLTAIDPEPEAVAMARARGVAALEVGLFELDAPPFDVVLVTRSLHHIGAIAPAVARAHDLVVPGGRLAIEEFAFERADAATAAWFYGERSRLSRAGRLVEADPEPADDSREPLERWREHHESHGVHGGATMTAAMGERFDPAREEAPAYLYRWFTDRVTPGADGTRVVAALLASERDGIASGRLVAVGLRLVMTRRT